MRALLLFHLRVGTRVAVRSFTPLFAGLLVLIMVQMDPAGFVTFMARRVYAPRPAFEAMSLLLLLALALPIWAVPQLLMGLNGWMRHLPISRVSDRRGLTMGLLAAQLPLAVSLLLLAAVASSRGLSIALPLLRFCVALVSSAYAAVPVRRRGLNASLCLAAALLAVSGDRWLLIPSVVILCVVDVVAGPVREPHRRKAWRAAGSLLSFRISWRALGWYTAWYYLLSAVPLGVTALFISNNELTGSYASGATRFGSSLAIVALISGLARRLALRRPPWPLARSFPWSAAHRVAADALFLGLHALPLAVLVCPLDPSAAAATLALIPLLATRAAGSMREMPARRTGLGGFTAEGFFVAGACALLAWSAILWLAVAPFAFYSARRAEVHQKVTRWLELHYEAVGDSLSWGDS
jgi:hypothetical protein